MSPIHQAREDIAIALDTVHATAADVFILAARRQLAPFNLTRHTIFFKTAPGAGLLVKDRQGNVRIWWELGRAPHAPSSVLQAIAEIGATLDDDIPEAVARRLDGVVL